MSSILRFRMISTASEFAELCGLQDIIGNKHLTRVDECVKNTIRIENIPKTEPNCSDIVLALYFASYLYFYDDSLLFPKNTCEEYPNANSLLDSVIPEKEDIIETVMKMLQPENMHPNYYFLPKLVSYNFCLGKIGLYRCWKISQFQNWKIKSSILFSSNATLNKSLFTIPKEECHSLMDMVYFYYFDINTFSEIFPNPYLLTEISSNKEYTRKLILSFGKKKQIPEQLLQKYENKFS